MPQTRTLANGAVAEVLPNGRLRIVKGASSQYLASIRKPHSQRKRGGPKSPRAGKASFTRGHALRHYKSKGTRARAIGHDLAYAGRQPHWYKTWKKNPRKYDWPGIDLGSKRHKKPVGPTARDSPEVRQARLANLAKARAARKKSGGASQRRNNSDNNSNNNNNNRWF